MQTQLQNDVVRIGKIPAVSRILDVLCRTTGMGFAAVARVTEDRWIACEVRDLIGFGLAPGGELEVESTICHEIRASHEPVIIDDVENDGLYKHHHTPALYGIKSYISMPIVMADGSFFGTLCAIDPRPAHVSRPEVVEMFRLFAELIAFHLDSQMRVEATEERLLDAQNSSEIREQFIAVLGHDLRNPLASIDAGAKLLQRSNVDAKSQDVLNLMQASVLRMAGLIENVMDFARGRLGGGITLNFKENAEVEPILNQVVEELRSAWPNKEIHTAFAPVQPFAFDTSKMAQLFSNLIGNALSHGAEDQPVATGASVNGGMFEFWVANTGKAIPQTAMEKLFQPFYRGHIKPSLQGLGLGLYISSEIAKAHGGSLDVFSNDEETKFTFRMPIA